MIMMFKHVTVIVLLAMGPMALAFLPRSSPRVAGVTRRETSTSHRRHVVCLHVSTSSSSSQTHDESIERLRQEYRQLTEKLYSDLLEHCQEDAILHDTQALLETKLQITAVQRQEQEHKAETAHHEMEQAIQELREAVLLKEQAEQETTWAVDEAAWLESMHAGHAELEALLLAHAAHDLKHTDDLWQKAQVKRLQALSQEVRAKDMLWFLIQREENLKSLQESQDTKALQKWAEHELPKHESIVEVLREKLVARDPFERDEKVTF